MAAAHDQTTAARRSELTALDLLRGMAALVVVLAHVRGTTFVEYGALADGAKGIGATIFYALTRAAQPAVLIFFVLSGYLVGGQIVSRWRAGSFRVSDYAIDRASRIGLPLIPACLLTAVVGLAAFDTAPSVPQLAANMVGLNGVLAPTLSLNAPLWTLAYEIWFYVLGGALAAMATSGRPGVRIAAAALLAASILVFSILEARYFLYWGLGATASFLVGSGVARPILMGLAGALLLLAGTVLEQFAAGSRSVAQIALVPVSVAETMICIGVFAMLPLCCTDETNRRLEPLRRPAAWLSGFSFSLYLFHYPLNIALAAQLPRYDILSLEALASFGLRVAALMLVCYVFYACFERNTPRVRRYLRDRVAARRVRRESQAAAA